ncbi:hypothetical protein CDAR_304541 [Caerostris darwini]|uniref:Uncharacterized protein n=1 Tax=Caerostris darwini TaxID=1538125 RepID=A0AAV4NJT2_9ARAC|nr:hypothetical protein CDAR_304541 [Caerostris darwini]
MFRMSKFSPLFSKKAAVPRNEAETPWEKRLQILKAEKRGWSRFSLSSGPSPIASDLLKAEISSLSNSITCLPHNRRKKKSPRHFCARLIKRNETLETTTTSSSSENVEDVWMMMRSRKKSSGWCSPDFKTPRKSMDHHPISKSIMYERFLRKLETMEESKHFTKEGRSQQGKKYQSLGAKKRRRIRIFKIFTKFYQVK